MMAIGQTTANRGLTRTVRDTVMARGTVGILIALLVLTTAGCAPWRLADDEPMPDDLSLTVFHHGPGSLYTYFELDPGKPLRFGGGRDAVQRTARQTIPITDAQRQSLWDLIRSGQITAAPDQSFAKAQTQSFDVRISFGGRSRTMRCVDDACPSVAALHAKLLAIRAADPLDVPGFR